MQVQRISNSNYNTSFDGAGHKCIKKTVKKVTQKSPKIITELQGMADAYGVFGRTGHNFDNIFR